MSPIGFLFSVTRTPREVNSKMHSPLRTEGIAKRNRCMSRDQDNTEPCNFARSSPAKLFGRPLHQHRVGTAFRATLGSGSAEFHPGCCSGAPSIGRLFKSGSQARR